MGSRNRDLASVQGTYRKVRQTADAIRLVARCTQASGVGPLRWLLDRPVSNNLDAAVIASSVPDAWLVDLSPA
jgi:hypothetical protein